MTNVTRRYRAIVFKSLLYFLLILVALVAQCTLPKAGAWQVRPALLILMTVLIAFFDGPQFGGAFGLFCGILCDWLSTFTNTFYMVLLMLFGILVGLLVEYSMRRNLLSAFFVSLVTLVLVQGLFFALYLWFPGKALPYALVTVTTPEVLYTLAAVPIFYVITKQIHGSLTVR